MTRDGGNGDASVRPDATNGDATTGDSGPTSTTSIPLRSTSPVYLIDGDLDGIPDPAMGEMGLNVQVGNSELIRFTDELYVTYDVTLPARIGNAVTLWWVVFNNPENCRARSVDMRQRCGAADLNEPTVDASLVNAGAAIVDAMGVARFGGSLKVGDMLSVQTGMGLKNPRTADVHLVLRDHGLATTRTATTLAAQLTTFNGGCRAACPNYLNAPHEPAAAMPMTGSSWTNRDLYWVDGNRNGVPDLNEQPGWVSVPNTDAKLVRTMDSVRATYHIAGAMPGDVISLWIVAFNNRDMCRHRSVDNRTRCGPNDLADMAVAGSITSARSAGIVRMDGTLNLGGRLPINDQTQVQTGMGLTRPEFADIHLVARNHGQLARTTSTAASQFTTFNGGCSPACPNYMNAPFEATP